MIAGDINAHSLLWNPHYYERQNTSVLKELIDYYGFFLNNEPGRSTQPLSHRSLVIDLALSTTAFGSLTLWKIPEEYLALSDYELILLRWEDIDLSLSQPNTGRASGWDIQDLIRDKNQLGKAKEVWIIQSNKWPFLDQTCNCTISDLDVEWIEDILTDLFNKYSKIMRVTSYSKKWWNNEVV